MAAKYPNVSRAEWYAMCQRSYELQRSPYPERVRDELHQLHEHMRAISHLIPTDGPPPRDDGGAARKALLKKRIERYTLPSQRHALNNARRELAELEK